MEIKNNFETFLHSHEIEDANNVHLIDISLAKLDTKIRKLDYICLPFDECFLQLRNLCLYIKELTPETYKIIYYFPKRLEYKIHTLNIINKRKFLCPEFKDYPKEQLEQDAIILNLILNILDNISYSTHNLYISSPLKIRYRNRQQKISKRIDKPIYIYSTKQESDIKLVYKNYNNVKIELQTSWAVRGHWRRLHNINSIGKNKAGEYIVNGFTWVIDYIKGNKNIKPDVINCYAVK